MGLALFAAMPVFALLKATINVHPEQGKEIISKHIYGQFAEHLGTCIYGGLWVGEDSKIPNTQGYRNDVLQALKDLKVPVLRWPADVLPMNIIGWMVSVRKRTAPEWSITIGEVQWKIIVSEHMNF